MQLIFLTLLIGVCYCAPSDFLEAGNDKFSPIGEASSQLNSEVAQVEPVDQPKYGCSIYDSILTSNCTDEADYYLTNDETKRSCCKQIMINKCKIRMLKKVCAEEEYIRKSSSLDGISILTFEETPECPKNYKLDYCDPSPLKALLGVNETWFFAVAVVPVALLFLCAIIFGIKYC